MAGAISSMTGFARNTGEYEGWRWTWELKSVNGRSLEMRFRLPPGFDELEPAFRAALSKSFARGSVFSSLQMSEAEAEKKIQINEAALEDVLGAVKSVRKQIDCAPPQAESILALRGVMESADEELEESKREGLHKAILASFEETTRSLQSARAEEGAAMAQVAVGHIDAIEALTNTAAKSAGASLAGIRDRIADQLKELLKDGAVAEDRLAQEAAIMAVKADVREELDRLHAHVAAGRALLERGGAVGRELDFLTQEFNRETNTLCSKAHDMDLKRTGLDLKKVVDQLREQIQNIE